MNEMSATATKSAAAHVADRLAAGDSGRALRAARLAGIVGGSAAEGLALRALGARVRRTGRRPAALALHLLRRGDWRRQIALEDEDDARAELRRRPETEDRGDSSAAEVLGTLMPDIARCRAVPSGDRRC